MVLKPLKCPENKGSMRPGAGVGNVEMVAAALGGKAAFAAGAGASVGGDPVAERGFRAFELTPGFGGVVPLVRPFSVHEKAHICLLDCLETCFTAWMTRLNALEQP